MTILGSIRRGLLGLLRFSGRDRPGQFWPYVLIVVGLYFAVSFVISVPIMIDAMARAQRFVAEHPDELPTSSGPGSSIQFQSEHPELMPDMAPVLALAPGLMGAAVVLLAAAVTRRLHDRGRSGWWGLMPLPFQAVGLVLAPGVVAGMPKAAPPAPAPAPAPSVLFSILALNNALYWGALLLLIVFLLKASDPGPNRFGSPEP